MGSGSSKIKTKEQLKKEGTVTNGLPNTQKILNVSKSREELKQEVVEDISQQNSPDKGSHDKNIHISPQKSLIKRDSMKKNNIPVHITSDANKKNDQSSKNIKTDKRSSQFCQVNRGGQVDNGKNADADLLESIN